MTIKTGQLYGLAAALAKLKAHDTGDILLNRRLFHLMKEVDKHLTELTAFRAEVEKRYFRHDENGMVMEDDKPVLNDGMAMRDYIADINRLLGDEMTIETDISLTLEQIDGCGIVAEDFDALDQFISA